MKLSKQNKADLWLLLVTFFWGSSYFLTDLCMSEMSPMTLNAFRFISAFIILSIIFNKNIRNINRITLKYSILIGLALTGTYIFYGYGIMYTSLSNAAFLCALAVIIIPILSFIIYRTKPEKKFLPSMFLCVIGLAFLTLGDDFSFNTGDILCLLTSLCYSIDLMMTEKAVKNSEVDPLGIGVCQLAVVGVITLIFAFILEEPTLPHTPKVWAGALILGLVCSGIAFALQSVQQQYTTSNHVGLIFTLEPVFASIVNYIAIGEVLTGRGLVGAIMMMSSLFVMEIDFSAIKAGKKQ